MDLCIGLCLRTVLVDGLVESNAVECDGCGCVTVRACMCVSVTEREMANGVRRLRVLGAEDRHDKEIGQPRQWYTGTLVSNSPS